MLAVATEKVHANTQMAIIFFIIETVFMELKIIDKSFPNGIESTLLQHFFDCSKQSIGNNGGNGSR
jgi:hypothetical protein